MVKPDSCKSCPLYGNGKGFVPDRLMPGSKLVVLDFAPGKDDERGQQIMSYQGKNALYEPTTPGPLLGASGYALRETYLPLTGERTENVSMCLVLKCRGKYTPETLKQAVSHCTTAHLRIPESTQLIVALGGPAFEFTQPELVKTHRRTKKVISKEGEREKGGPITTWRGFLGPETLQSKAVFAVQAISDLFRDVSQRLAARLDWKRAGKALRGEWPRSIPTRLVATDDTAALNQAFNQADQAPYIICDTEFNPETKFLSLIGLGWELNGTVNGIQLEWVGNNQVTSEVRSTFIRRLAKLAKHVRFVFQNAKADLVVIQKNLHISWEHGYGKGYDDTMHMHMLRWSEMPHGLEFLASIYGQYPKLKHLMHVDELLYNWGDVIETLEVYKALLSELKADPLTLNVYTSQSLPLIPIIMQRESKGIRINQVRLNELIEKYTALSLTFDKMAYGYAGYPLNLMSSGGEGQLANHLLTYEGIKLKSVDEEHIATERDKYLPFDREQEDKHGFTQEYLLSRIEQGAQPLLELRAASVYYKQALNQDLLPIRGKQRVYPSYRHDAQASGRWSTTKPALAKVPNDFLSIYVPDEGYMLFGMDYDAQEPRIFMAEAKSEALKRAFNEKLDIHTMLVCDMFSWAHPPNMQDPHFTPECQAWRTEHEWGGKEDKRRTVSKNVRFERYYMGTGKNAVDKAVKMGLPKDAMLRASKLVIDQDPNVAEFHRYIKKQAKTKQIRTFTGRLRTFLGTGEKVEREMANHKMQGGGVDILNLTLIEVITKFPQFSMFYTRHDAFYLEIAIKDFTPELAEQVRLIAEQTRLINGMSIAFPGSWKTMNSNGQSEKYTFNKGVKVAA